MDRQGAFRKHICPVSATTTFQSASIQDIASRAENELKQCADSASVEAWHGRYLSKTGELTAVLKTLKDLSVEEKKTTGKEANELRQILETALR
jgi:phenylalanyl-tRNA synthetase alpha chain